MRAPRLIVISYAPVSGGRGGTPPRGSRRFRGLDGLSMWHEDGIHSWHRMGIPRWRRSGRCYRQILLREGVGSSRPDESRNRSVDIVPGFGSSSPSDSG